MKWLGYWYVKGFIKKKKLKIFKKIKKKTLKIILWKCKRPF